MKTLYNGEWLIVQQQRYEIVPNVKYYTIAWINTIRHLCCTIPRMLTKLNKIDKNLVPWMCQISFFFFLLAKYSQRVTNKYFFHKTILVRDMIAQIHTKKYAAQSYCDIMRTAEIGTKLHDSAMVRSVACSAPIGLYTTSLLGVVTVQYAV